MELYRIPDTDSHYMGIAWTIASFSTDLNIQNGALIVNSETNTPLSWGFNNSPVSDVNLGNYVFRAEENAMDHANGSLEGADLYLTHPPSERSMLQIINKGISRVVYTNFEKNNVETIQAIAKNGEVLLEEFQGSIGWLPDWILTIKALGVFEI